VRICLRAASAGAVFATAMALPNRVDAMTLSTPSGVLSVAVAVDVAQLEQVRWCGSWLLDLAPIDRYQLRFAALASAEHQLCGR
jgi:hypothetical protein